MKYDEFLKRKIENQKNYGFDVCLNELSNSLFDFQRAIVKWALKKGRCALFEDCGLGKTIQQLEWSRQILKKHPNEKIIILTPLAVANQTMREAQKFNIKAKIVESDDDVEDGINITNYEKIHKFDMDQFTGVVLDESSILKSFTGKMQEQIINQFKHTKYKLACTATPAPNDYMELGNHAEFLGIMSQSEMLAKYFIHDGSDTSKWRLKGHAEDLFWEWISDWAVVIEKPSTIGFKNRSFALPPLTIHEVITDVEYDGILPDIAVTLNERRQARKNSMDSRLQKVKEILDDDQWLIWCDYNYESSLLKQSIKYSVEIKGSDTTEHKTKSMVGFSEGNVRKLITKPSIAGFGMNWQNCSKMIFFGLSDSYEQFYQAVRRSWRFGQIKPVDVYIIMSESEILTLENIKRKHEDAEKMKHKMAKFANRILAEEVKNSKRITEIYIPKERMVIPEWLHQQAY